MGRDMWDQYLRQGGMLLKHFLRPGGARPPTWRSLQRQRGNTEGGGGGGGLHITMQYIWRSERERERERERRKRERGGDREGENLPILPTSAFYGIENTFYKEHSLLHFGNEDRVCLLPVVLGGAEEFAFKKGLIQNLPKKETQTSVP